MSADGERARSMRRYGHYIGGKEVAPRGGTYLASENPYTGEAWAEVARGNAEDVAAAVSAAKAAFSNPAWSEATASKRAELLRKVADLIVEEAPRLAQIEQRDNGKLAAEVNSQVRYVSDYFHYYAGLADKVQGHVVPNDKGGALTYIRYEPKGVVGIITPWNSPLTLTSWKLAPALAAGCTAVIKPSEFTSCAIVEFADLFRRAGFPDGVVNVVSGLGDEVGPLHVRARDHRPPPLRPQRGEDHTRCHSIARFPVWRARQARASVAPLARAAAGCEAMQ